MATDDRMDWHRLLGVIFQDFCRGTALDVELEKDLSLRQQFLDVILLHKRPGAATPRLPDGFEDLAAHNLITFKSHQETLDGWTLKELIGHYVNYRKQASPSKGELIPEADLRLFAISARYPGQVAGQLTLTPVMPGVYDCVYGLDTIRLIVLNQLAQEPHNAMLQLFSAVEGQVRYAAQHWQPRSDETTTLLQMLLEQYRGEGIHMSTIEEWFREKKAKAERRWATEMLKDMTAEEVLQTFPPEEVLKLIRTAVAMKYIPVQEQLEGIPVQERLEGIPVQERLEGIPVQERLEGIPVQERLEGIPVEELRALLNRLEKGNS